MEPGSSMYFDAQALQDQDEAELLREEEEQQKELQERLAAEFDDLIDDDDSDSTGMTSSAEMDDSHNVTGESGSQPEEQKDGRSEPPASNPWPPLSPQTNSQQQDPGIVSPGHQISPRYPQYPNYNMHQQNYYNYPEDTRGNYGENPEGHIPMGEWEQQGSPYGPIGGEYKDHYPEYPGPHMAPIHEEYPYPENYNMAPQYMNGYYQDGYYGDGFHGYATGDGHYMSSQESTFSPHHEYVNHPDVYAEQFPEFPKDINHNSPHAQTFSPKNYEGSSPRGTHVVNTGKSPKDLENYKVQYVQKTQVENQIEAGQVNTESKDGEKEPDSRQFLDQGGAPDTRQLAQLQILYSARGRKLDEMTRNYEALKEETSRETRIMRHKIAQIEGEREGLAASLQQTQSLLQAAQEENSQHRAKISNLTTQLESMNTSRLEFEKKLEDAESTISDLNEQLIDLTKADSLSRVRDRQDTLVHSIQQKHEKEMFTMKEKMDETLKTLEEKKDEIDSLRQQLTTVMKSSEMSNLDRTDTINRLTKSLDESQQRCRELLEKGSPDEVNRLKVHLVQAEASKSISDDLCQALQDELHDLKEQLSMYETAASFGIYATPGSKSGSRSASPVEGCQSDSFVQLNIKSNSETKIPRLDTSGRQTPPPSDGSLKQIKVELERCLHNYGQKQAQVRKLQEDNMAAKKELTESKRKFENLNLTLKQERERIELLEQKVMDFEKSKGQKTLLEERLEHDVARLESEKFHLVEEMEALQNRMEEFANNEERLTEMNNELSTEMSQIVRKYNDEKTTDIDRYQATLQQHYEDAKMRIHEELVTNFNEERRNLISSYQAQVDEVRHKLDEAVKELLSVKDLYVTVCREKDGIEERVKSECRAANNKVIDELKEQLNHEKEDELKKLRLSLMESNQVAMTTVKDKWWKEKEEDMKREVEAQVAMAKVEWFEEHKNEKHAAADSATKNAEREWKIRLETEVEAQLETRLKEAQELWVETQKCQVDNHVEKQVKVEKEKLQTKFQNDLKNEEKRWEKEAESRQDVALQRALSKAKADWLKSRKESEVSMRSDLETSFMRKHQANTEKEVAQAVKTAREKWLEEKRIEIADIMENNKNMMETELQAKLQEKLRDLEQEAEKLKRQRDQLEQELKILKEAGEEEKQTLIKLKDIEIESLKSRRDKLEQDFTGMKKSWLAEKQDLIDGHQTALQKKEAELKNFRQLCNRLEIENKSLMMDKEGLESEHQTLKLRREDLEREVRSVKESWLLEKEELIRQKEVEKREAVNAADDQHEKDKKTLVDEHNEMLERALKAAKEQFEKEKNQIITSHEADVERLREHERKSLESFVENDTDKSIIREMESKFSWERNEVERIWQKKLLEAQTRYEKECDELTKHFQETMEQLRNRYDREQNETEASYKEKIQNVVEEAKKERENLEKGWEKKLEWTREAYEKEKQILQASHREDMKRALEQVKKEKETENSSLKQEWQTQHAKLIQELESRDRMLKDADRHIETEIERLRKDLETEHEDRLHKELENLRLKFETEFSRTVDTSTCERQRLQDELEKSANQLRDLEQKYEKVIMSYQDKLEMAAATLEKTETQCKHRIDEVKNSLETEYNDIIDSCEREKNDFATKFELCQEQLHRVRNEREELEVVHGKCEKRLAEMRDWIRKGERQVLDSENQKKQELEQLKKTMESHHQVVVEAMKAKVIEVRKHHTVAMETLKKQHLVEKQDLTKRTLQDVTNKISQTESIGNVEKSALEEMRTYYLNTVNKIRDDVMKHVNDTNNRAAKTVRTEMTKERHITAKTLKQHYLQCFRQLLAQNNENLNLDAKLSAMEKALDLAPIKGMSGSRCSTPQPPSAFSPTGNNFTPVTDTNDPRSHNASKASNQSNVSRSSHSDGSQSKSSQSFGASDVNVSTRADATTNTENSLDSSVQKYWNSVEKNRNGTRSSEKYPVRNNSPNRSSRSDNVKQALSSTRGHSEVSISGVHEISLSQPESLEKYSRDRVSPDLDNTQPIRDVNTSGYRSMSYLSRSPESDRSHILKDGQRSPVSKSLPPSVFNNKYGKSEHAPRDVKNHSYKYTSLLDSGKVQNSVSSSVNFTSYMCDDVTGSHLFDGNIDLAEVGLNKIPLQPRPYNPPAERLISDDSDSKSSSSCMTPSCDSSKPGPQDVIKKRDTTDSKKMHYGSNNASDQVNATPRRAGRSSKSKSTEKSGRKSNQGTRSSGVGVKLHKPVALCTRHTQVPSPTPFRDAKYS